LPIEIVRHAVQWKTAVLAFTARMHAGGSVWGYYVEPEDAWLPARPDAALWREHYLAVEDGKHVRGGYALKIQSCWLRGQTATVCDYQGPVSEGTVDPRYSMLALRLFRDMARRQPLLYSWGHGGEDPMVLQILRKLGWWLHETPFCLRVLRPARFLHRNAWLRKTRVGRVGLDLLAGSGVGWLGLHALHGGLGARRLFRKRVSIEPIERFGAWADELWERCKPRYTLVAARDAANMNALLPVGAWPPGIALRVLRGGETIGFVVVMDTVMKDDARFGDLRVGSIVDCFGLPEDAADVAGAGFDFLRERGVDLVVANLSHPAWSGALARHGFVVLPRRRTFAASPELRKALEPIAATARGIHLTSLDGHGPHAL
jgi:hypothetical protein